MPRQRWPTNPLIIAHLPGLPSAPLFRQEVYAGLVWSWVQAHVDWFDSPPDLASADAA